MLLQLGRIPTLVVSSADMAREVMKTQDFLFCSRPRTTAAYILAYKCVDVGYAPYGEYWRRAKKLCILELLSQKRVVSFQYVRDEEVAVMVKRVLKASHGSSINGDLMNVSELVTSASKNIVSRCVLGKKFEDEDGKSRFGEISKTVLELLTAFCVGDMFPAFGWMDGLTGLIGKLKETSETLDSFLDQVVEEHMQRKLREIGKKESMADTKDFVDILLEVQQENTLHFEFTRDNLKALLLDMFVGGTDTTATALEWTMAELVRHPASMKKAQEEVRGVVGQKPRIDPDDINKMGYLKCVIKESLRLHPPLPLSIPRETAPEVVKIQGFCVPSKTRVLINIWAIQRDPKLWNHPDNFIPERFLDNPVDLKGHDLQFTPFGGGRRMCPGMAFGLASAEYIVANLLHWFDWKVPHELLDMNEASGLTAHKKVPLYLKPIPYTYIYTT